jgi:hypothetical protein
MACFTGLDYRNKSYEFLITIKEQAALKTVPIIFNIVPYGCYDAMSDAAKMYQFYDALTLYGGGTPITENCFVQKTEDQQLFLLNGALALAL